VTSPKLHGEWKGPIGIRGAAFTCAHCEATAAPHVGFTLSVSKAQIAICPRCTYPTLLLPDRTGQIPAAPLGRALTGLPANVKRFYDEARRTATVEAWDGVALLCRTLLLHVAVEAASAPQRASFEEAVDALQNGGWIPPTGRPWVDQVRAVGNKAAHKADPVTRDEATMIMRFVELLLANVYEAPAMLAGGTAPTGSGSAAPPTK
jgi:hypothetical protein